MEIIKIKILLEDFISRSPSLCMPINGWNSGNTYGNWGEYIYSLDLNRMNPEDEFYQLKIYGIQTYKSLMRKYFSLKKFYNNAVYYKYRTINNTQNWYEIQDISYDYISGVTFYDSFPNNGETFNNGDIIGINPDNSDYLSNIINNIDYNFLLYKFVDKTLGIIRIPDNINGDLVPYKIYACEVKSYYDELIYNRDSNICCDNKKYESIGGDLMLAFLSNKLTIETEIRDYLEDLIEKDDENNKIIPKIPINILITNNIDDIGVYTPTLKEWNAGQRYYIGDKILYNGSVYTLYKNDNDETEIPNGSVDVGFVGYYNNKTLLVEFDEVDINGNFKHWSTELTGDYESEIISAKTQSNLIDLARKRTNSVDDRNNELPGILIPNSANTDGYETYLDIQFSTGITYNTINFDIGENSKLIIGDEISAITYTVDDIDINFNDLIQLDANTVGEITFTYFKGLRYSYSGNTLMSVDTNKAIMYSDRYAFTLSEIPVYLRNEIGEEYEYIKKYIKIDFDSKKEYNLNSNFGVTTDDVILSDITYNSNQIYEKIDLTDEPMIINSNIVKNEYLFGVTSSPIIKGDVFIDRGSSSAIEKHLKLIEIKTFQDLENYGNGFFNLK